jgi:hypothetical protein
MQGMMNLCSDILHMEPRINSARPTCCWLQRQPKAVDTVVWIGYITSTISVLLGYGATIAHLRIDIERVHPLFPEINRETCNRVDPCIS